MAHDVFGRRTVTLDEVGKHRQERVERGGRHLVPARASFGRMVAPEHRDADVAGVVAPDVRTLGERRPLFERHAIVEERTALVEASAPVHHELIADVAPSASVLMEILDVFDLL